MSVNPSAWPAGKSLAHAAPRHEPGVAQEDLVRGVRGGRARAPRAAPCLQASAPSEPSSSKVRWFFRPALTCEIVTCARRAVLVAQQHVRDVLGRHRRGRRARRRPTSRVGLDRAGRNVPHVVHGVEVGEDGCDAAAGDPARQVEPVRADVGDGAQRAADARGRAASSSRSAGAASPGRSVPCAFQTRPSSPRRTRARASWQSG